MNFDDLMDFEKDDVGECSCYVCGTNIDVVLQDVVVGADLNIPGFVTLPVCGRCSSAVGVVIALEDQVDRLATEYVDLLVKTEEFAGLLEEGVEVVTTLKEQNFAQQSWLDADSRLVESLLILLDEKSQKIADLERRIEAGVGLNDVEVTVIASAAYED